MKKGGAEIMFFCVSVMILGPRGPPRGSFEDGATEDTKTSAVAVHSGRLFWSGLAPKSDFCAFVVRLFFCLFFYFWYRFWVAILQILGVIPGYFLHHFEHFFVDAAKLKKWNPFKRNACFGRCWASVFVLFLPIFEFVFYVAV